MDISFVYPQSLWLLSLVPATAGLALLGSRRPSAGRFWAGLALRLLLLTAIVLALAGIQVRLRSDTLTVVFLLDVSDSIPPAEQARGQEVIRQAIVSMPPGDRAAVVVFGQDALVERLASEEIRLSELTSAPVTFRTDIASALQLGLALFPDEGAKRMVLLSDGRENLGYALDQAELAAAHSVEITFLPLEGPKGDVEVLVDSIDIPADIRLGQGFDIGVVVHSTSPIGATLRIFADGQLFHSREVNLRPGPNRFLIPVEDPKPGFNRYRAQIIPDSDTRLENNEASAYTIVHGPPLVLLVEGKPGEGDPLERALQAADMEVHTIAPERLPITLPELAAYDAVILANVAAPELPHGAMETLPVFVRDLGRGLLMVGGDKTFGAGGYLRSPVEEALPVYMEVRARELSANLALVLAVDKSGSMGRCHCDDPNLAQNYTRQEVGQPKVDIAKEAVMRAASAIGEQDLLGVVAFDDQASWALDLNQLVDYAAIEHSIGGIQAFGQTNIRAGVEVALERLLEADASRKHVILLTDGWSHSGDIRPLVKEMADQGITLSVVAAGSGSAEYLKDLAEAGEGRYWPAEDILSVPDIFLKDTVQAAGQYIIEEPFYPLPSFVGPVLRGLDAAALPALYGYNGTSPKNTARIDLATPRGDPLLATWQYGLGRSAAWTSDLKSQWASDWVAWEGYSRFVSQLVGWLLPSPQQEGLNARAGIQDGSAVIQLEAVDEDGRPRNFLEASAILVGPDLASQQTKLPQVAAGQYQARVNLSQPGTYLVNVTASDRMKPVGQLTLGLVVPYSPEYRHSGADISFLRNLARVTGGAQLAEPEGAFVHNLPAIDYAREIWRPLLMSVALLFPIDIALRRVMLGKQDLQKGILWLRERLPSRQLPARVEKPALSHLFQARQRARRRLPRSEITKTPEQESPAMPEPESRQSATRPETEDTLARLQEAKKRARKGG